jgi:hypothetical protein
MKRRLFNLAILFLVGGFSVCNSGGCSSSRYGWQGGQRRLIACENGKVIELRAVDVREPYDTPFLTRWHHLLVQPCAKKEESGALPCWPANQLAISQSTLRRLASNDFPDYRRADSLQKVSTEVASTLGVFGRWIVGTRPLAIAFFDDPPASAETYRRRVSGEVVASTQPTARRGKHDGAEFVSTGDLTEFVTVVVVFSETSYEPAPAKVFTLKSPTSLQRVSELVCMPAGLERACADVMTFAAHSSE